MKRLFDFLGALFALLLTWPVIVAIALLVRWKLGKPVLFKQWRPGLLGKPICLYKFRTMAEVRDEKGDLLPDDVRLTDFGKFLRRISLDELPQLFNVLKGDLSLVGPRPLLMEYLPRYTLEQLRRHQVKPGITGWAQVNGRNAISWEERFKLDVWYVDNHSFWLDLRILLLTVLTVLKRKDVSAEGSATMPEFLGSPKP
jgi:sugar transferase EpsL